MTFAKDLLKGIPKEWKKILKADSIKPELQKLINALYPNRETMCPTVGKVFQAFRECPYPQNGRPLIVIFGQDPYHQPGVADGMAFSCDTYQSSVRNIFKCLANKKLIGTNLPKSSNLLSWARQGVLLLNTALTVEAKKPKSHSGLWEYYMAGLIEEIQSAIKDVIFVGWGKSAEAVLTRVKTHNTVLTWGHPSGANRINSNPENAKAFINCTNFDTINKLLEDGGHKPIDWRPYEIWDMIVTATEAKSDDKYIAKIEWRRGKREKMISISPGPYDTIIEATSRDSQFILGKKLEDRKEDSPIYIRLVTDVEYLQKTDMSEIKAVVAIREAGGHVNVEFVDTISDPPEKPYDPDYRNYHNVTRVKNK